MKVLEFAKIFRTAASKPLTEDMARKIAEHVAKMLRVDLYGPDEMGTFWKQEDPRVGYYNMDENEFGVVFCTDRDTSRSVESQEDVPEFIKYIISRLA